jgi:hypothetical protein
VAQSCAARYRARNPRATPLYRLFEAHFDEVRGQWEERFERRCGFWRGFVDEGMRPGMVSVVQTAGDLANWHPHVHAIVSRGGWTQDGEWIPVAFVDEHSAELLYRHKVMRLLQDEGLLSDERTELLLSWRHTGFSVHNRVRVEPEDQPPQFVRRIAAYSNVSRGKRRKAEAENAEVGDIGAGPASRAARAEARNARALRRSWAQLMHDLR